MLRGRSIHAYSFPHLFIFITLHNHNIPMSFIQYHTIDQQPHQNSPNCLPSILILVLWPSSDRAGSCHALIKVFITSCRRKVSPPFPILIPIFMFCVSWSWIGLTRWSLSSCFAGCFGCFGVITVVVVMMMMMLKSRSASCHSGIGNSAELSHAFGIPRGGSEKILRWIYLHQLIN